MARTSVSKRKADAITRGNVFADLGAPDAEERRTKLKLAYALNAIMEEDRLTQAAAAAKLGLKQPKVSALRNYKLEGFSVERLMTLLNALDQDVEIVIRAKSRARARRHGLAWWRRSVGQANAGRVGGRCQRTRDGFRRTDGVSPTGYLNQKVAMVGHSGDGLVTTGKISASAVRYIKLGISGKFEERALKDSRLYLGYHAVSDGCSQAGDWDTVYEGFLKEGDKPHIARIHARQVQAFYEEPESCLWITFVAGDMWWTFAKSGVTMCIEQNWKELPREHRGPSRYRSCVDRWSNKSLSGRPLNMSALPGYVTKTVSGFRGTVCQIDRADAVLRIINDETDPHVQKALDCRKALVESIEQVIDRLYWKDFETLVDLIFQRSGWPRVSRLGGNQKLIEFELENPVTGERSFAQVKSQASQNTLDDYAARFDRDTGYRQMFFVCHTANGKLLTDNPGIFIWTGAKVADMTVKTGLADWVLEKVQ
jgi:predicted XRE-type DNA-binding protein